MGSIKGEEGRCNGCLKLKDSFLVLTRKGEQFVTNFNDDVTSLISQRKLLSQLWLLQLLREVKKNLELQPLNDRYCGIQHKQP